jgi:hypothetical protein
MIALKTDKEGDQHTEYLVEYIEKTSRTYSVRGVKSMAEAIGYIEEYGYDSYDEDRGIYCQEMDGWWKWIADYKPKAAAVKNYSACKYKGRTFKQIRDDSGFGYKHYCTNYMESHEDFVCSKCTARIENGWILMSKEE